MSEDVTICQVASCLRPSDGWFVCAACSTALEKALAEMPWLFDELELVVQRQVKYTRGGGGSKSAETPVMFNEAAANMRDELNNALTTGARLIAEANGWTIDRDPAAWLRHRITAIRLHVAGAEIADEIFRFAAGARWVIDKPPVRQFLGYCSENQGAHDCPGKIYGRSNKPEARCDTCGLEWEAEALRQHISNKLDGMLLTAAEIARLSTYISLPLDREQVRKRINQWAKRGRIESHAGPLKDGAPLFRYAEVLALLEQDTLESA